MPGGAAVPNTWPAHYNMSMDTHKTPTARNMDLFGESGAAAAGVFVRERNCRTLIGKSGIPGVEFAANTYAGCAHACVYCYAKFMGDYTGRAEPWGAWVDARVNAADVVAKQLATGCYAGRRVMLGSVTDAYQPIEEKYALARALLPLFARHGVSVDILTKSPLVCRDMDILKDMPDVSVGFSIAGVDEHARAAFEPGAPPYADRLAALQTLSAAGIHTWVFVAPVLPGVTDRDFATLLDGVRAAGPRSILFDKLNHATRNVQSLMRAARAACPESLPQYRINPGAAAAPLKRKITAFQKSSGIPCRALF